MEHETTLRRDIDRYRRMLKAVVEDTSADIVVILLAVAEADMAQINERANAHGLIETLKLDAGRSAPY
jgi:hypothetical protein